MSDAFGASWAAIAYVAGSSAAVYFSALLAIRLAGRRTVAQFSSFDIIVTIAIGSIIATTAISRDVSYAEGTTALVTLLSFQTLLGWLRQRFPAVRRSTDFSPLVVVRNGRLELGSSPFGIQATPEEVVSKLREQGVFELEDAGLVVVEPTGGFSVLRRSEIDAVPDAEKP